MTSDAPYRDVILAHYRAPRGRRPPVGAGVAVRHDNPVCGDEIVLEVVREGPAISASFDGRCCALALASASMLTEAVHGLTPANAARVSGAVRGLLAGADTGTELDGDLLALAPVARFPVRVRCTLLPWDALDRALGSL